MCEYMIQFKNINDNVDKMETGDGTCCLCLTCHRIVSQIHHTEAAPTPPYHHINMIPMRLFMTRADFGPISLSKKLTDEALEHSDMC